MMFTLTIPGSQHFSAKTRGNSHVLQPLQEEEEEGGGGGGEAAHQGGGLAPLPRQAGGGGQLLLSLRQGGGARHLHLSHLCRKSRIKCNTKIGIQAKDQLG